MQKKYILAAALLCLVLLSYLFYHSCKRDTIAISPAEKVSIPDSSWLYGSLNLKELRKDIAWSSITNGDFNKLFQNDTSTNTLFKILKSPSSYSITEQNNIQYFSLWKNNHLYAGLLFTIENKELLLKSFKSASFKTTANTQFSFRTKEGYWLYNNQQLLFIGKQAQDSVLAHSIFNQTQHTVATPAANDSLYATCIINTIYYQDSAKHPLLDSTNIYIKLRNNDQHLALDWTYSGPATDYFNQAVLTDPDINTGFYFTCNPSKPGLEKLLELYQGKTPAKRTGNIDFQSLISMLQNNTYSVEFNGWKKQKKSFFVSELNDEFEMILAKKDSGFFEPCFYATLIPADKKIVSAFLSSLQKQGLISNNNTSPFRITLGDFDSELLLMKDSSLIYQNKHAIRQKTVKTNQQAACIVQLKPALLENLFTRENHVKITKKITQVKAIRIDAFKEKKSLHGSVTTEFQANKHPILALIELLKHQNH